MAHVGGGGTSHHVPPPHMCPHRPLHGGWHRLVVICSDDLLLSVKTTPAIGGKGLLSCIISRDHSAMLKGLPRLLGSSQWLDPICLNDLKTKISIHGSSFVVQYCMCIDCELS